MMSTIFGKIVRGELPCQKVYENEKLLAIYDIHPAAPIHILLIPKKEIPNLQAVQGEDYALIVEVVKTAQMLAKQLGIDEGYRLLTNNGEGAGQTIDHLHFHLLGGKTLHHDLG